MRHFLSFLVTFLYLAFFVCLFLDQFYNSFVAYCIFFELLRQEPCRIAGVCTWIDSSVRQKILSNGNYMRSF